MRPRPSRRLNSEWTWRCVKSFGARVVTSPDTRIGEVRSRVEWYRCGRFAIPRPCNPARPPGAVQRGRRDRAALPSAEARRGFDFLPLVKRRLEPTETEPETDDDEEQA